METRTDIDTFLEKTNVLHDGYIIGVEFHNNGIIPTKFGYEFRPELKQLTIRVLITSIYDAVLEMVFDEVLEWRVTDSQRDIIEAAVFFNDRGFLVWTDDAGTVGTFKENDSYVVADRMKWRII